MVMPQHYRSAQAMNGIAHRKEIFIDQIFRGYVWRYASRHSRPWFVASRCRSSFPNWRVPQNQNYHAMAWIGRSTFEGPHWRLGYFSSWLFSILWTPHTIEMFVAFWCLQRQIACRRYKRIAKIVVNPYITCTCADNPAWKCEKRKVRKWHQYDRKSGKSDILGTQGYEFGDYGGHMKNRAFFVGFLASLVCRLGPSVG